MHKKVAVLTVLMSAFVLSSTAYAEKTFVYCSEGSPSAFNAQVATDGATFNVTRQLYNRLVEFKPGATEVIPALGESWKISKDNLTVTFKLKKGVKFHTTKYFTPTRDFNADDVIYTFNRMRSKDHPYNKIGGGFEYFDSMEMGSLIKDIKKVDDLTVQFVLSRPEAPILANLAMDFAGIISKEYAEKLIADKATDKLDFLPIGTGPFQFVSYQKDTMIRLEKNPQYWRTPVKLDKIVYLITVDSNVRTQKLRTGECHLIAEPAPQDIPALKANKAVTVYSRPGLNMGYMAFNVEKKPFDNVLVRQAIAHAINKKALVDAIFLGNAEVAKNPMAPGIWSYNDAVKDYEYNTAKAQELLKKAGFPNGLEAELWTLPVARPYMPNGKKAGELIQSDLAKIGVKLRLVSYDWPTYLAKSAKGDHQLLQMGWTTDNGDPDNFLSVLLSCAAVQAGNNRSRWCYEPYDKIVTQARATTDTKKRIELYKKAQLIFKEQTPFIPLAHAVIHRAASPKLKNYRIDPFGGEYFERLDLE